MSEFDKALDALAEDVIQPWSPTVKDEIRAMIVKFLEKYTARSMIEKVKHTLTDEPYYHLLLTWPEIQALIDLTDSLPRINLDSTKTNQEGVDFNKLCGKMSEQLKWQAQGPDAEAEPDPTEPPGERYRQALQNSQRLELEKNAEPEPGFDEHCHCNRGIREAPNGVKYCPKHGYEYTEAPK